MMTSQTSQKQPHHDEADGDPATDAGSDARRLLEIEATLEERAQHPATVERERGQQVERGDQQVEPEEPDQDRAAEEVDGEQRQRQRQRQHPRHDRDPDTRRGPGDRHRELVSGVLGQLLQLRDAADREELDLVDDGTTWPADEAVRELVHEHAREDHDEPRDAGQRARPAGRSAREREQRDEQEERDVHPDLDARDAPDPERVRDHVWVTPAHRGRSVRRHDQILTVRGRHA